MSYNVTTRLTKEFQRDFKRLAKKYPSLIRELAALQNILLLNPVTGIALGNNTFKIRLAIKSKGKGKSGGARVITYVETELITKVEQTVVTLLTIYDKSEVATVSADKIRLLIESTSKEK